MSGPFPERLSVAVLGLEPDYGYWTGWGGRAFVLGRALAPGQGEAVARRLSDVPRADDLATTAGAKAYAAALSACLREGGHDKVGVDLLVLHEEREGLGGFCVGSAGVWAVAPEIERATPDRTVGAQLKALNVTVDAKAANLQTTRILARGVEGGDPYYAGGTRAIAMIGWPLPDLGALPPFEVGGSDPAEVLGAMTRLVTRQCACASGVVAVWKRE